MNATELEKLDKATLEKLTDGVGPSDECICSLLAPSDGEKRGLRQSIKKAFASIGQAGRAIGRSAKGRRTVPNQPGQQDTIDVPLVFTKGAKGVYTTKEAVKSDCGKCGCANENVVLKHSYANIRITSPDISSICPCPSDCLPEKSRLSNNIKREPESDTGQLRYVLQGKVDKMWKKMVFTSVVSATSSIYVYKKMFGT
ncbi:hypothetical protein evm_004597 [Chilo suppressalis]|nr:hypothetical protein evm_004597 [Chilo suppressalis]